MMLDTTILARRHTAALGVFSQHCLHFGSFNTSALATTLSQLAGVLSGFAFFAVIYVLTNADHQRMRPDRRATLDRALLTLFCATVSLAITSIQYGILAGDQHANLFYGRAASEELLADISLSLSIFVLMAGMVTLVALEGFGRTLRVVRLATIVAPPVAVYFVAGTAREVAAEIWAQRSGMVLCGHNGFYSDITMWGQVIAPILTLAGGLAVSLGPRILRRHWSPVPTRRDAFIIVASPVITVAAVLASVGAGASLESLDPRSHLATTSVWAWLVVTALLTLLQAFAIRLAVLNQDKRGGTRAFMRWRPGKVRFKPS